MKIIQITNGLPYGAAITNDILHIQQLLKRAGIDSEIFAEFIDCRIPNNIAKPIKQLKAVNEHDIILFHPNLRAEKLTYYASLLPGKKILRHHIFTPWEYSQEYSLDVKRAVLDGNKALLDTKEKWDFLLPPSSFNLCEMRKMGYNQFATVVPYLVERDSYCAVGDKKRSIIDKYTDGCVNILYVSRIVPNKKQEDAIQSFAYYHKHINKYSRLILVGIDTYPSYKESLEAYCQVLGISNAVIFAGSVSFEEIIGYYQIADLALFSSEHEGFGIPLIEAMLFNIPIIAYEYTAIPETLKGAGVLLREKDPVITAYWIDKIMKDNVLYNKVIEKYKEVSFQYDAQAISDKLFIALGDIIKNISSNLEKRDYMEAMSMLSRMDRATAGQIWR